MVDLENLKQRYKPFLKEVYSLKSGEKTVLENVSGSEREGLTQIIKQETQDKYLITKVKTTNAFNKNCKFSLEVESKRF